MRLGYHSIDFIRTINGINLYHLNIDNVVYQIQEVEGGLQVTPSPPFELDSILQRAFLEKISGDVDKHNLGFVLR